MSRTFAFAAALALLVPAAARADADPLAAALQDKAPAVLEYAKKKGYANIGVLKFLVQTGDGPPTADAGDLNLALANKTEVALILANDDPKFGIIDKASAFVVREKMTSANHLNDDGRRAFFTRKFDLAWSKDKVEPAAFVTGLVAFSPDLKKLTIKLQVFDKSGKVEDLPDPIAAETDAETLAQAGLSYSAPPARVKALVAGDPPPAPAVRRAETVEAVRLAAAPAKPMKTEPFAPLADCPVKWKVLYNGKPAAVTGNALAEPNPDDRVEFVLSNPGPGTFAVVLMVNGENTLYQERNAPAACRKWVLAPNSEVTVKGFQTEKDTAVPFKVLRPEEPMPDSVGYGPHAGTFRLVVYHGSTSANPPAERVASDDPKDAALLAIAKTRGGTRPEGVKPQSLRALQAELRGRAVGGDGARGYVVKGGAAEKFETDTVYFHPSSGDPVADISLRYFAPKN